MKFGIRECCDVVLKAKANQKIGNKVFYKGEPVCYFDTLKTSSLEGAATTTYATGGRGNARLMAWEGERTLTFTMEDALISPESFMILSGAGLIEGVTAKKDGTNDAKTYAEYTAEEAKEMIQVHVMETSDNLVYVDNAIYVTVDQPLSKHTSATIYAMVKKGDEIITEPYIGEIVKTNPGVDGVNETDVTNGKVFVIHTVEGEYTPTDLVADFTEEDSEKKKVLKPDITVMADYYTDKGNGGYQIEITPDKFGGNYYLEASTLFRNVDGVDMPAEFIIPNCKIQSNFSFSMSSSGDPSTFTFTMDAFPDYTRFDGTKKVLAAIQIINDSQETETVYRDKTVHNADHDKYFID